MIVRSLNRRMLRLAFPLRSTEFRTLTDTQSESEELDALHAMTSASVSFDVRSYIEAPFQYRAISRFSNGSYGVLYSADSILTATKETTFHLARAYADANAPAMETRRTRLAFHVHGTVVDARKNIDPKLRANIYDPQDYTFSQQFGAQAREAAQSVHFDSVRNPDGGHCLGAFTPAVVRSAEILGQTALVWDGNQFTEQHEIDPL